MKLAEFIGFISRNGLVFCIAIMVPAASIGGTQQKQDFSRLVEMADAIVVGTCVKVESHWRKNKIYTSATLEVSDSVEGNTPSIIQVEYLGGTALHPKLNAPVSMKVSNGVSFAEGEHNVLFLKQDASGNYRLIGKNQGKIVIDTDQNSGHQYIHSGVKKIRAEKSENNSPVIAAERMPLSDFLSYIRSILQHQKQ